MESVIQNKKRCFLCGTEQNLHLHHCIYGNANRKKSTARGFCVWLCYEHHEGNTGVHRNPNKGGDLYLKQLCQTYYEKNIDGRQAFIKEFGRSWL